MSSAKSIQNSLAHFAETLASIPLDEKELSGTIKKLAATQLPVICSGVGKSGFIAAKLAATLNSLDIQATFLNPTDALHGDLGIVADGSIVILISNSGTTLELRNLAPSLQDRNCQVISIVSDEQSPLAKSANHVLNYGKVSEVDEFGLAPTTSTVVQLAIVDALAAEASRARNFQKNDFFRNHPSGALGKRMMKVEALMRQGESLPVVVADSPLEETLATISAKRMGCACVVDEAGRLVGLITDGDIRHALENRIDIYSSKAADVMQAQPQTARLGEYVEDLMQADEYLGRHFTVPILDSQHVLCGVLVSIDLI